MLRALLHKTAWLMDKNGAMSQTDKVSMLNYWANRFCGEAADRAIQIHGGLGYSRHKPFEHIYRHHRRYRITEGTEEIQMRRVAGYLFGFMKLDPAEAGCLDYTYATDFLDPGRVRITEHWADEAALTAHFAEPHMAEFQAALANAKRIDGDVRIYAASEIRRLI